LGGFRCSLSRAARVVLHLMRWRGALIVTTQSPAWALMERYWAAPNLPPGYGIVSPCFSGVAAADGGCILAVRGGSATLKPAQGLVLNYILKAISGSVAVVGQCDEPLYLVLRSCAEARPWETPVHFGGADFSCAAIPTTFHKGGGGPRVVLQRVAHLLRQEDQQDFLG